MCFEAHHTHQWSWESWEWTEMPPGYWVSERFFEKWYVHNVHCLSLICIYSESTSLLVFILVSCFLYRGTDNVIGVRSTLRCNDNIVFVLPYFPHQKFQVPVIYKTVIYMHTIHISHINKTSPSNIVRSLSHLYLRHVAMYMYISTKQNIPSFLSTHFPEVPTSK